MKRLLIAITVWLALCGVVMAQERDRRIDLEIPCGYRIDVSTTGQLWLYDRCGHIWKADSIGDSWHTMFGQNYDSYIGGPSIERIAGFGSDTAIAAGYMHDNIVLRTTTGGATWDSVEMDNEHTWVHGFCFHRDGKLWMASSSGRSFRTMAYSDDRGKTFKTLKPTFPDCVKDEDGIKELFMFSADSGFAGTYGNRIYSTRDNWRTAHRIATPQDQGLVECRGDCRVTRLRQWHGWLIATQDGTTAYTALGGKTAWRTLPIRAFETDPESDRLWAITDSGQLVLMHDMEHWTVVKASPRAGSIIGTQGGCVYIGTNAGVVRIAPDGKADTCGFFTEEKSLEEYIDEAEAEAKEIRYSALTQFSHGGRQWLTDRTSIYLRDAIGWYRIAKPYGIVSMVPDPDHDDRVIIQHSDQKNYSVDTAGRMEPYTYRDPFGAFLEGGVEHVTIETYTIGCFHYHPYTIAYSRKGDKLVVSKYSVGGKKRRHRRQKYDVGAIAEALRQVGERYSQMPTDADFGLKEGVVDWEKVFNPQGWCTSSSGYRVTFVNGDGDTLTAAWNSSADCGKYFPMLLPMMIAQGNTALITYRPELWNALKPLMPEDMFLRSMLSKYSLLDIRPGDLLFFRDTAGMGSAVKESTGEYTHVAIVETVGDSIWVVDATQRRGVSRHAIESQPGDRDFPDVYRIENPYGIDVEATLERARSYIGRPYDNAFEPGSEALYCSELVYECYLRDFSDEKGEHLFETKAMNWRDQDGNMPQYWTDHFARLGKAIPEGVEGTNPTDLSRSILLRKVDNTK